MAITAKSVVFDVADNFGATTYISIRSIEFKLSGAVIPMTSGFTAYATSYFSASYLPSFAFNTSLSKTGTYAATSWVTSTGATANQRLIIVFDSPVEFDEIVINNGHYGGDQIDIGAKNVIITASADEITSTTYNDTITNGTVLFNGTLWPHPKFDIVSDKTYYPQTVPAGVSAKSVVIDIADDHGCSLAYMSLRSVEFLQNGEVIPIDLLPGFTAYASTSYSGYTPAMAFSTYTLKTGAWNGAAWVSGNNQETNQRLIVVFAEPITFDEIRVNNGHSSGSYVDSGVNHVRIAASTDEITSTTYNDTITNGTVLFDGIIRQHVAANYADDIVVYTYGKSLWTPEQINTELWLDASDSDTITIVTGVSQWADKSGNDRHWSQANTLYQPAVNATGNNGLKTITFGGTQSLSAASELTIPDGYAVAVIVKWNWVSGYRHLFGDTAYWHGANSGYLFNSSYSEGGIENGVSFENGKQTAFGSLEKGSAFKLFSFVPDGTATIGNTGVQGGFETTRPFIGDFAEILVFPAEDREKVEGYLAHKWGTEATLLNAHPYRFFAPTVINAPDVSGFANKYLVTIDKNKIDADLTDFCFPVILNSVDHAAFFTELGTNFKRVVFTPTDLSTQYAAVLDTPQSGKVAYHVKIPAVDDTANTQFYLHYDNAQPDNDDFIFEPSDFGRIESPLDMTGATSGSITVTESSVYSATYPGWKLFDYTTGYWVSNSSGPPAWVKIDFGAVIDPVTWFTVKGSTASVNRNPKDFVLEGSTDNTNWDTVATVTGETGWASNEWRKFVCDSPGNYRYYRLTVTDNNGDSYCELVDLRLFSGNLSAVNVNNTLFSLDLGQDPSTGNLLDHSGEGHLVTPGGTWDSSDLVDSVFSKGADFSGANRLSAKNLQAAFGTTLPFTIEVLYKPDTSATHYIFDLGSNLGCIQVVNGRLCYYNQSIGTGSALYTAGPTLSLDTWYLIHIVHTAGNTKAYYNKVEWADAADNNNYISTTMWMGCYNGTSYYATGVLDIVNLYPDAKSTAWINARHAAIFDALLTIAEASGTLPVRAFIDMPYGNEEIVNRVATVFPYSILLDRRAMIDMVYSLRLAAFLDMKYGDCDVRRAFINLWYSESVMLRRSLVIKYDDLLQHRQHTDMEYAMPEVLRQSLAIRYSIAGTQHRAFSDMLYDLQTMDVLRRTLVMPYLMQGDSLVRKVETAFTIGGRQIGADHLAIEPELGLFAIPLEAHLTKESDYIQVAEGEEILVTVEGLTYRMLVDDKRVSRSERNSLTWIVEGLSPAVKLTADWSGTLLKSFEPSTAFTIIDELVAEVAPELLPIDFQLDDFPMVGLYANNEDRATVIGKILETVDATMRSEPDGLLVVFYEEPEDWLTREPDFYISSERNFLSQDDTTEKNPGYNRFLIGNQTAADDREWTETRDISKRVKEVLGFQTPWDSTRVYSLGHSGGDWVQQPEYMGVVEEIYPPLDEDPEVVEFVAGFGETKRPIYTDHKIKDFPAEPQITWIREQLGAVTFSEDGRMEAELKDGRTDGYSLAEVRYCTRFHLWRVRDDLDEAVQYLLYREVDE